jgi:hypothetical protein
MSDATADTYEKYLEDTNTGKKWMNNAKLNEQAAAIENFASKVPEVVAWYEKLIGRGEKLRNDDKKLLEVMLTYGKPPSWMPRVESLLKNPSNFA